MAFPTHGMSKTPTYESWVSMLQRCINLKHKSYPSYGGRGITVCERWKFFPNFLADMGIRPEGTTLGRIHNSKNYYPLNCRWETPEQQYGNKRSNRYLFHHGQMDTIAGWARRLGLLKDVIYERLKCGWATDRVLTEPLRAKSQHQSGFPCVRWARKNWRASLKIDGKRVDVGRANTPLDAYLLRVKAAAEYGIPLPEGDRFLPRSLSQKKIHDMSVRDISVVRKDGVA